MYFTLSQGNNVKQEMSPVHFHTLYMRRGEQAWASILNLKRLFGPKGGHVGANGYTGSQLYCQVAFGKTFRPYPPRFLLPRLPEVNIEEQVHFIYYQCPLIIGLPRPIWK